MAPASGPPGHVSQRLARLKAEVASEIARRPAPAAVGARRARRRSVHWERSLIVLALVAVLLIASPFVLLVRTAVLLYERSGYPAWLALALAGAATLALVAAYAAWLLRRFTGRARLALVTRWVALPLVVGYTAQALLYLSRSHAKADAVRVEYRATHPVLRLALATLILTDDDLMVTDLGRAPEQYAPMGLAVNEQSLHLRQRDGWSHAVDLRTRGRTAIRNWLVGLYFRAMGFRALRHVGTADHLHVELPMP